MASKTFKWHLYTSGVGYALVKRLLLQNLYTVDYPECAPLPFAQKTRTKIKRVGRTFLGSADGKVSTKVQGFLRNLNVIDYLNQMERMASNTSLSLPRLDQESSVIVVMACRNLKKAEEARKRLVYECTPTCVSIGYRSIVTMEVDLLNPDSVFKFCDEFKRKFDRLDVLYANAGYYPVDSVDYLQSIRDLYAKPAEIFQTGGSCVRQKLGELTEKELGVVFTSNVLSHFIMVRQLEQILSDTENSKVVWTASSSAQPEFFSLNDYQCLKGEHPYESSKRATDLLSCALNVHFAETASSMNRRGSPIQSLLASPGNVITNMMQNAISVWILWLVFVVGRVLLGVNSNNIDPYNGAESLVRLCCATYKKSPEYVKWHSVTDRLGNSSVEKILIPQVNLQEAKELYNLCEKSYRTLQLGSSRSLERKSS